PAAQGVRRRCGRRAPPGRRGHDVVRAPVRRRVAGRGMTTTTRDHVAAATRFVLGPSNFVVIRLPEQWDLRLGRQPMDVDYTVAVDGVRWAQEGRASGLLVDLQARRAIELSVRTSRGPIPPPKLDESRPGTSKVA